MIKGAIVGVDLKSGHRSIAVRREIDATDQLEKAGGIATRRPLRIQPSGVGNADQF
jgi:hypothetical protein